MTTQQQIKELEQTLKEATERLEKLKNRQSKPWEPRLSEDYFCVETDGEVELYVNDFDAVDNKNIATGNYYQTRGGAEMHLLRLRSMKRGFMPKVGEEYWTIGVEGECVVLSIWSNDSTDLNRYNLGRTFKTGKDAGNWTEKYAATWKFVEGVEWGL